MAPLKILKITIILPNEEKVNTEMPVDRSRNFGELSYFNEVFFNFSYISNTKLFK